MVEDMGGEGLEEGRGHFITQLPKGEWRCWRSGEDLADCAQHAQARPWV